MKAMIFSAGLGTRFKPWTDSHPKALALINGKSLLQRNVEYLRQHGIKDVIVNVHHFAGEIIDAVNKNNGWGSNVMISDETDEVLETGGGLIKAKDLFTPGENFLTINADILTDLNLKKMISYHLEHDPLVSLAVTDRATSRCFVFNENNLLCGWRNISSGEEKMMIPAKHYYNKAFSGVSIFKYDFFEHIQLKGKFSLVEAFLSLAPNHAILSYDHTGDTWVDVGRPESVAVAEPLFQ
jgi:MurNAc alpha-1-phosphate uridylyltransferase